jgi:hypothetical protein
VVLRRKGSSSEKHVLTRQNGGVGGEKAVVVVVVVMGDVVSWSGCVRTSRDTEFETNLEQFLFFS